MRTIVLILFVTIGTIFSQSKDFIIKSNKYFYGTGTAFDVQEARDKALSQLTQQIAVRVASSFERKLKETGTNLNENVQSILKTHSMATLRNVQTIQSPLPDGRFEVFCYLEKSEVQKIFNERKQLIYDMYQKAQSYEQNGNTAHALKLYYFITILMNSIPEENIVFRDINFTTTIPERINAILQEVQFQFEEDKIISEKEREVTLKITRNGEPVSLLDFTFWDGTNQVTVQARDGIATFLLLGASAGFDKLQISIKYAYYEARDEYAAIADLWSIVDKPVFQSGKLVPLRKNTAKKPAPKRTTDWKIKLVYDDPVPVADRILHSTVSLLNHLKSGNLSVIRAAYRNDPFLTEKLEKYIKFNHTMPIDKPMVARLFKTKDGYELRKIQVLHQYPSLSKQTTEYMVLDFDHKGNLRDINLAITENLFEKFMKAAEYGNDAEQRHQIIKFIEKYRMAYMTRDIETVDMMFAEDALIIVGRKIERKKIPNDMVSYKQLGSEPDYKYIKLTKQQYLQRLHRVFRAQEDIFLNFSTFEIIRKNQTPNVYGVEMRQTYNSTTYSDEGYLFLLIDFSEKDPLIYVRAWQPDEWNDSSLVKTANFKIYK